jgi:hypothetical protein
MSPSIQQSRSRPTELVSHSHRLPFTTDNCRQSLHSHSLPVSFACAHIASSRPLLPTLPIESPPQQSPSSMTQFLADTVTCPVSSSSRLAVLTDVSTSRSGCPCAITTRRRLCAFSPLPALDSPLTPASPLRVSPPPLSQSEQCDLPLGLLQHHEGNGTRHISIVQRSPVRTSAVFYILFFDFGGGENANSINAVCLQLPTPLSSQQNVCIE